MASSLIGAVVNPVRNQGLVTNVAVNSTKELVKVKGPGLFLSAEVTKQGGNSDITFVILDIDGQNVVNISIAALFNQGLTSANSYGISVFRSGASLETVTIGFPYPLTFNKLLSLKVTVNEPGVVQILANVITAS
ncbi:hypothetical protein GFS24_07455 [Chitinophaga sp. SYP-B3965]|uniref:hypothetical protein n=1 Tax=Chitinophaga sp. SYP-B3965 TaxID=2663120 RepID=UPI0012998F99|nr:hypothetical protein [Chitinophaga sp. SYP-B3965]MRG44944.1 hypothetical protein [Chitinophaga sp. SYP-B3965]